MLLSCLKSIYSKCILIVMVAFSSTMQLICGMQNPPTIKQNSKTRRRIWGDVHNHQKNCLMEELTNAASNTFVVQEHLKRIVFF